LEGDLQFSKGLKYVALRTTNLKVLFYTDCSHVQENHKNVLVSLKVHWFAFLNVFCCQHKDPDYYQEEFYLHHYKLALMELFLYTAEMAE